MPGAACPGCKEHAGVRASGVRHADTTPQRFAALRQPRGGGQHARGRSRPCPTRAPRRTHQQATSAATASWATRVARCAGASAVNAAGPRTPRRPDQHGWLHRRSIGTSPALRSWIRDRGPSPGSRAKAAPVPPHRYCPACGCSVLSADRGSGGTGAAGGRRRVQPRSMTGGGWLRKCRSPGRPIRWASRRRRGTLWGTRRMCTRTSPRERARC